VMLAPRIQLLQRVANSGTINSGGQSRAPMMLRLKSESDLNSSAYISFYRTWRIVIRYSRCAAVHRRRTLASCLSNDDN
jgi:hypothetical protein